MKRAPVAGLFLVLIVLSTNAFADVILSGTGSFSADDDKQQFSFSLSTSTNVTMRTWSFAGGTNANGQVILTGGFAPILTLFSATGTQDFLGSDAGGVAPGSCGSRNVDPGTSFCLDAYMNLSLTPGDYLLVLTQYDNTANGPSYPDGFLHDGEGNFTGGPFILNAGNSYQRTGDWAVDITTPTTTVPVPEPSTGSLLAMSIGLVVRTMQKRRF